MITFWLDRVLFNSMESDKDSPKNELIKKTTRATLTIFRLN